jgi:RNA polymerase sigma-70 factor (ECF subfamily)
LTTPNSPPTITGTPADEQAAIDRALGGDLNAFNALVVKYQRLAYSVAFRMLQEEESAADAVQESFIKAYRALASFKGGLFKSWLMRIVVNTCYDVLRSRKRYDTDPIEEEPGEEEYAPHLLDKGESPQEYVERMELGALIELGIRALPAEQRLVLTLCDVHGYSYEEIAEITGMNMGTVKSRINRARTKLRDFLIQKPELLPAALRPKHE